MTTDVISFIQMLFTQTWNLFSITCPGTVWTFGNIALALLVMSVSLKVLHTMTNMKSGNVNYRSRSSSKPKISKEREHDEL